MHRSRPGARALLLALFLLGPAVSPAQQPQSSGPPAVDVATPLQREIVDRDVHTGRFEAVRRVEIRARVSGYLQEIAFRDGAVVGEGDLLFRIDPRTFEAAVARAKAQVQAAEATLELARIELSRATRLAERNVGTEQEVDRTQATVSEASAQLEVARAELRAAELDLEFTEIRAPIAGRMSASALDTGNLVTAGTTSGVPLSTVVSTDPIHFVFTVSEADFLRYSRVFETVANLELDTYSIEVAIRLMDEEDFVHTGKLNFVDIGLDPNSGTSTVRAVVDNPDGLLVPGLFGRVRMPGSLPYEALLIPDSAILSDQSNKIVMTVGEDGTVSPRRVTLGGMHGGLRVIRDGLAAGDRVVVNGVLRARPGQKVTPEPVELSLEGE